MQRLIDRLTTTVFLGSCLTGLTVFWLSSPVQGQEAASSTDAAVIFDLRQAAETTFDDMAQRLLQSDVVFLGEEHDNDVGHQMQLAITKRLFESGRPIAVSMEMFERDVQGPLDDYLRDRISEEEFLKHARPWKNYAEHYRPIVEFAKENRLDVLAANVPRPIASKVASAESVGIDQRPFIARSTTAPNDLYKQKFVETMSRMGDAHAAPPGHGPAMDIDRVYQSQCLKDDTMAEAITDYQLTHLHNRPLIVHLVGKFHSDYGVGLPARVLARSPLSRISVVTMETTSDVFSFDIAEHIEKGHFLLLVPPQSE